ncbi:MAG: DnaA/Hda family protein [Betaproteobacteria bacterium]|nr:DnaA/Hda family protein [Betaproteobacteria bacterium]MDH5210078.1 DnaA/Hda family protein [Betaproteobacteria bacterium]
MTRQLALPLQPPPAPSLENFVPGANGELLARLRELAAGRCPEAVIYLWGAPGSGRSHLLTASARPGVTLADDVERLDATAQIALFNAINEARDAGGTVLAAGNAPPAQLALREDLRSRLGWGLVYEVKPLTDAEKAVYLHAEAARRGLRLSDEVVWYLLTHVRRDMPSLGAILEHLDRASLEQHRALTLPLVREALRALEP